MVKKSCLQCRGPGLGRSPGGGHGNPLLYSCLENPHGQRSLAGYGLWGHKESDMTEQLSIEQHVFVKTFWTVYIRSVLITICKLYFNLKKVKKNKGKRKYLFSKDSAHGNKLSQDACNDIEKNIDHLLCVVCKNIGFQRKRHLLIGFVFSVDICVWSFIDSNHPKNTIPMNAMNSTARI